MSDELTNRLYGYDADWATRFSGKTLTDEAADEITALRARLEAVEKRAEVARWNVDEDGNLVRLCRGDHDKDENCSDHEELFVPLARAERAEAALVLHQNLDAISVDAVNRLTARAERAEAALATARRDALEEAAMACDKIVSGMVYFNDGARKKDKIFADRIRALKDQET